MFEIELFWHLTELFWDLTLCKQKNYTNTKVNCLKFNSMLNDPKGLVSRKTSQRTTHWLCQTDSSLLHRGQNLREIKFMHRISYSKWLQNVHWTQCAFNNPLAGTECDTGSKFKVKFYRFKFGNFLILVPLSCIFKEPSLFYYLSITGRRWIVCKSFQSI